MNTPARVTLTALSFVGTYVCAWFASMMMQLTSGAAPFAVAAAVLAATLVWLGSKIPFRSTLLATAFGAVVGGSLGAVLGFFLPMVVMPSAAQGPLAALFGAPAGIVLGVLVGYFRVRQSAPPDANP